VVKTVKKVQIIHLKVNPSDGCRYGCVILLRYYCWIPQLLPEHQDVNDSGDGEDINDSGDSEDVNDRGDGEDVNDSGDGEDDGDGESDPVDWLDPTAEQVWTRNTYKK
jgi:hypothetical protein